MAREKDDVIARRKAEHLRIVAEEDVANRQATLLGCVQLQHQALPELDLDQIDTSCEAFGKRLAAPLMICAMSGGAAQGRELNLDLAEVSRQLGLAFSVGSQRIMLRRPETRADFAVRPLLGDGLLLGNIGAPQLLQHPAAQIAELMTAIDADALTVHLNAAQELCQPEGDKRFAGQLEALARLVELLPGRVMVKETGAGISPATFRQLRQAGVRHVDVAGAGGTSWTRVEWFRAETIDERAFAETFADWGIPTAVSIAAGRRELGPEALLVGSGGVRTGLDCARAIALGADIAGVATPVLKAWTAGGKEGALRYLTRLRQTLVAAMLLTGCADLAALRAVPRVYLQPLERWLAGLA